MCKFDQSIARLFGLVLLVGGGVAASTASFADADGVFPIVGSDTNLPDDDLKPFGDIVDGARVVGLGESIHTSGGYYQAKDRLIRYLVEKKGVRVFGMETPWILATAGTNYVANCQGDATAAVKSVFHVFQDTSTRDLFAWLCQFNANHPQDPVEFFGFDIQEVETLPLVVQGLQDFALDPNHSLEAALQQCAFAPFATTDAFWKSPIAQAIKAATPLPPDHTQTCLAALGQIQHVAHNLPSQVPASRRFALERASYGAAAFQTLLDTWSNGNATQASLSRDQAMAANFIAFHEWLGKDKKAVIWAHNYHIARSSFVYPNPSGGSLHAKVMGAYLKERYGNSYAPFALTGYHVLINWPWSSVTYPEYPTVPASLVSSLHDKGYKNAFVDFNGSWLMPHAPYFFRGGDDGDNIVPANYYRGMFFFDESRANIYVQ